MAAFSLKAEPTELQRRMVWLQKKDGLASALRLKHGVKPVYS
jgi:hypothetical protein